MHILICRKHRSMKEACGVGNKDFTSAEKQLHFVDDWHQLGNSHGIYDSGSRRKYNA